MTDATRSGSVLVDSVQVEDRHRRDLGDLTELCDSITRLGLLHPIVVTRDRRLVAGQRRLEACRKLGHTEIRASFVDHLDDASELLVAERDENTCRKAMTASELYVLGKALEELERPKAAVKQAWRSEGETFSSADEKAIKTHEVVAPAVGLSGSQWSRLKHLGERAASGDSDAGDTLEAIDRNEATISGGYESLRQRDKESPPSDIGNVGDVRSIPKRKRPAKALTNLAKQVKNLGDFAKSLDTEGLTEKEAASIADDLSEGLSALTSLKNQLRKV